MNAYNFNHLYYFYITAKLEGITVAAKHLNTSQSSLSVQIKNLEHNIGKSLFKKVGRHIELTEDGKELFQFCRRGFEAFEEMSDHVQKSKTAMGVRLNIGVSSDIDRPFITEVIAKVIRSNPLRKQPLIKLISKESAVVLDLLKAGEIDFAITTNATIDGQIKLHKELIFPVMAFASKDVLVNLKKKTAAEALKEQSVGAVLPAKPTILRAEIESYFVKRKFWPVVTFESNIVASVIRAAIDGLGIALLPTVYVSRELKSDKLFSLSSDILWKHRLMIVSQNSRLPEEKALILEQLLEDLQKLNNSEKKKP